MSAMASQITSLTIVDSTVYSCAFQRKHQSSVSLVFVRGIHRWPVNSPHKGPGTRKMFPFDDIFMLWDVIAYPCLRHLIITRILNHYWNHDDEKQVTGLIVGIVYGSLLFVNWVIECGSPTISPGVILHLALVALKYRMIMISICRHWWHRRLSLWQPAIPPVTTKLALWYNVRVSVFFDVDTKRRAGSVTITLTS